MSIPDDKLDGMVEQLYAPLPVHDHHYTVPVEWQTIRGDVAIDGQHSPDVTKVTALKCDSCPSVMKKPAGES